MNTEHAAQDDNKLIALVQSGQIAAYEDIVFKYQNTIAMQMRRFSSDQHDVEDLTQQVFINAFTSIDRYKPKAPFLHWLRTIASRTGYTFWREKNKTPTLVKIEDWDGASVATDDDRQGSTDNELQLELLLNEIKPNERHVICLMYLDNKSIAEIREITGWSQGKIKMLAHRGRKRLKELLLESGRIDEYE